MLAPEQSRDDLLFGGSRQAAPAILETWVREAREITARADSSEQDRAWAGEILAAYGAGEGKR